MLQNGNRLAFGFAGSGNSLSEVSVRTPAFSAEAVTVRERRVQSLQGLQCGCVAVDSGGQAFAPRCCFCPFSQKLQVGDGLLASFAQDRNLIRMP